MLVISAGLQKSGSSYMYNLINDLLVLTGCPDAKAVKEKYGLQKVMRWNNNNVGRMNNRKLLKLTYLSIREGSFAVKTHWRPPSIHGFLQGTGLVKTIYIYRDPRDVYLSAKDHGRRILENGGNYGFAKLVDLDIGEAAKEIKIWTDVFNYYQQAKGIYVLKYEGLIAQPFDHLVNIVNFLGLKVSKDDIHNVLRKYEKKSSRARNKALHYNKGVAKRYEKEMSDEEITVFEEELGEVILQMGYPLRTSIGPTP